MASGKGARAHPPSHRGICGTHAMEALYKAGHVQNSVHGGASARCRRWSTALIKRALENLKSKRITYPASSSGSASSAFFAFLFPGADHFVQLAMTCASKLGDHDDCFTQRWCWDAGTKPEPVSSSPLGFQRPRCRTSAAASCTFSQPWKRPRWLSVPTALGNA